MKRRHNKFVILVIFVIALLYVGNLVIDNPYTHSIVNYYLNDKILKKLPIRADYQSMKLQLAPPALTIYGLKVETQESDAKSHDIVSMSTLTFKISLWSIFMGQPQIGDLELKDVNFSWPPPANFMEALRTLEPSPAKTKTTEAQWPPSQPPPLSSLKISNASIVATLDGISLNANQDAKETTRITAEGFNADIEISDWKSFKIDVNSSNTSITDRSSSYLEGGKINFRGEMRNKTFIGRKIEVASPRLNLTAKSTLEIKTKKNSAVIESLSATINGENVRGDMSSIGSFLDISGSRGAFSAKTITNIFIPITTKQPVSFSTTGSLKSYDARFYDFRLYETETNFEVDQKKFKLLNTNIKIGDDTVATGGGQILFDSAVTYDFDLKPSGLPFRNLLDIFNVDVDAVNFDLTSSKLAITGTGDPFKMSVTSQATLTNFSTPSAEYDHTRHPVSPQCEVNFNLEVDSTKLDFKNTPGLCYIQGAETQIGKFPLLISGATTFESKTGMDIVIASSQFNPAPLSYFAQAALGGRGEMTTRIVGPYDRVRVELNTDLKDAVIGSTQFATLGSKIQVVDGKITWNNTRLTTPTGGQLASDHGELELNEDLDLDFELQAKLLDRSTIGSLIRDITDGSSTAEFSIKSATAKFSGPAKLPLAWKGSLEVNIEDVRTIDERFAKSIKGTIKGTDSGYITEDLVAIVAGAKAEIRASHTRDKSATRSNFMGGLGLHESDQLEISTTLTGIPKSGDDLRTAPIVGKNLADLGISAEVSGDFKLAGTFKKLTGLARLQLSKTKVLESSVSDIIGSVVIDGSKLDIMAEQGGSALKARISLDLGDPNIPFNWYIAARNADFRPWLPAVMSQDARNFAYLSATWILEGTFKKWWDSRGELDLKDLRLRYYSLVSRSGQRVDFRSAHPSKIIFDASGWHIADNQPITISSSLGQIKLGLQNHRPPSRLGITTSGKIDVETLRLFLSDIEIATGSISVDGGITGSVDNPNVDIAIKDDVGMSGSSQISLGLTGFRPSFQEVKLDSRVRTNGITIKNLSANKGNGQINIVGFLARPGSGEDTDVTINLDNAAFLYPFPIIKYFDSSIDGQLKITGTGRPWTAAGLIAIRKARSNRDVDLREAIVESIRSQSTADSTNSISPLINMDISIAADKSIGFSSRSGQATLSSDLRVAGTNIMPSIVGLVDISKGRFFYKRDFEIKRGLINFDDPIKVDPALDISATSDVSSYRVGINITGRASTPIIDFTVEPPTRPDGTALSKIDIIGLLNRGSLSDNPTGRETAESTAASEALNILAGQVEDTVQKIFDLSGQNVIRQVYIDTYESEGSPVARFNLPLNITEDFDVILKVDQTTVKVSSEYSLHDSISLTGGIESSNDQSGISNKSANAPADTGVDLKFKFAFP